MRSLATILVVVGSMMLSGCVGNQATATDVNNKSFAFANGAVIRSAGLHTQLRTLANDGYVVQQIEAADGTVVREYMSPAHLVFGVAWQGPKVPDLTQLLGVYFPVYQAALPVPVHRRAPVVVHTESLVVDMEAPAIIGDARCIRIVMGTHGRTGLHPVFYGSTHPCVADSAGTYQRGMAKSPCAPRSSALAPLQCVVRLETR